MNKTQQQVYNQNGAIIHTLHPSTNVHARIYSEEQRREINRLISEGYLPHHSSVGTGNTTKAHWTTKSYKGRFGEGILMLTTSPYSSNFNHKTYFLKQAV